MNNNIYTSQKDSICGRDVENENGFNTNNNNNNGEDHMESNKRSIEVLTKKEFKALSKGQAYNKYEIIGEVANNLKIKADEALEFFKAAKQDTLEAKSMLLDAKFQLKETETELATIRSELEAELATTKSQLAETETKFANMESQLAETETELAETETELANTKSQLAETETKLTRQIKEKDTELASKQSQLEETEIKLAEVQGKNDAGFDLVHEIQNDLDDLSGEVVESRKAYSRISARMTGKKARANINAGTIRHYNNIIRQCKKDIEAGKDVNGNKAKIFELQAEIRNLQRQVDAANGTFNEMKRNKTTISQKIVAMDNELDKRYKLQNLLGELGYI